MKKKQGSPLLLVWSFLAALVAVVGIAVAVVQPAWAAQTHTVTIAADDEKGTVLYKKDDYALGKTQISALELLKKAGVNEPGKVQEVKLQAETGSVARSQKKSDDELVVVKKEAKQTELTIVYGDEQTELKLKLTCEANQTTEAEAGKEAESNAPPAVEQTTTNNSNLVAEQTPTTNAVGNEGSAAGDTVTAQGDGTTYNVTVTEAEGGSAVANPDSGEEGTEVTLTATPDDGYLFKEWQVIYGTPASISDDTLTLGTTDVVVKAVFEAKPTSDVTITFDANGGEGNTYAMKAVKGASTALLPNQFTAPTDQGFVAWNAKADGSGQTFDYKHTYKFTTDMTLYAQWDDLLAVTFDANATDATGSMGDLMVTKGVEAQLTKNAFVRVGYDFTGWNTAKGGTGTSYSDKEKVTLSKAVTLYAQWEEAADVTIKFDANADDTTGEMDSVTVAKHGSVTLAKNAFVRVGYDFTGWNTKADGSGKAISNGFKLTAVHANVTLYAQWTKAADVTVSFDANGGTGTMSSTKVAKHDKITLAANAFARSGYTFSGWNTKADGSGTSLRDQANVTVNADVTLYAQWTKGSGNTVTISFDANGGYGEMDSVTGKADAKVKLPTNTFENDGYYFVSWNTAADGSGTSVSDGATIKVPSSNITLYAQWKSASEIETQVPVVTNSAGGNYTSKTAEVTFTISQVIPADATYARIWFDLHETMYYTSDATVSIKDGDDIDASASANGQRLEVIIDDASTIAALRGKTVTVVFKAKVKDGADLSAYQKSESGVAYIPYQASTEFEGAKARTVSSETKNLRIKYAVSQSSTKTTSATTKKNSTLAKTADPTSMAAVVTMAVSGAGLALAGLRRRK